MSRFDGVEENKWKVVHMGGMSVGDYEHLSKVGEEFSRSSDFCA